MNAPVLARAAAIVIAGLAIIDPAITRERVVPVPIAIVHGPAAGAFAATMRRDLAGDFVVHDGPSPSSVATVIIRSPDLPLPRISETGPVFVVDDEPPSPLHIRAIETPPQALVGRAVAVDVLLELAEAGEGPLAIELRADGRLVASETRESVRPGRSTVTLRFVPLRSGVIPIEVEARQSAHAARASSAATVRDRKLRVHVIDPRPSWSSTFVRRALEDDPAFTVTAETVTSRGVAAVGGAAVHIDDPAVHDAIDALVVGTPSSLSNASIASIEQFARRRGGAVIMLGDADAASIFRRFTGIRGWRRQILRSPIVIDSPYGSVLASDALVAAGTPITSRVLASAPNTQDPHVQELPAGAGRVIVSGMLDDWRHRANPASAFMAFWRGVAGDAALAAAEPVTMRISPERAAPGELVDVDVAIRGVTAGSQAAIEAELAFEGRREAVRFWPASAPGVFSARVMAPAGEGLATITVAASHEGRTLAAEAALLVSRGTPLSNTPRDVAIALASARGGAYVGAASTDAIRAALRSAFPAHRAPAAIHPMRYAWWLAPFTLLLGYEWRWRRQRGLK